MTQTDPISTLARESMEGSEKAFRELVERIYAMLYRVCWGILGNEDESRDAVQETFVKIWKHLAGYDARVKFMTWAYRMAVNTSLDRLRVLERRRPMAVPITDSIETGIAGDAEPESRVARGVDLRSILPWALSRLTPVQRLTFALRDLEDLSIEEVTRITGQTSGSVRTNLSFARRHLRQILDKEFDIQGASS